MSGSEQVRQHTKAKRADGFCAYGGCWEESGDEYRCPKHRREHAAATKRQRKEAARARRPEAA